MIEKKYEIVDANDEVIASDMDFDCAIVFIKGFRNEYYLEPLELTIREMERVKEQNNE